ncbi:MAG: LytTR family DNA-binding domain-containing protein [Rikenellaceae bacterium]
MLRSIAIDDEPLALRQLEAYISRVQNVEMVSKFRDAVSAEAYLLENQVDLIFCDINMPELSGVDFVRNLQERMDGAAPMVIFTTAYSEYAVEGFRLDAVDYLLKPFTYSDLERAAQRAYSLFMLRHGQGRESESEIVAEDVQKDSLDESISIKADYKVTLVKLRDIIYMESEGEYVRLHLQGARPITTFVRLKNMEAMLPSSHFVRTHRSYIVNLNYVKSYERSRVYLSNDDYLPIGQNYRESFLCAANQIAKISTTPQ